MSQQGRCPFEVCMGSSEGRGGRPQGVERPPMAGKRREAGCVQWQRRMDLQAWRTPYGKAAWVFPPGQRHGAALVIVAEEWKPAVRPVCGNPLVAVGQWNEASLFRKGPRQPQAGKRALHSMDDGERAPLVAHERGRVDGEGEGAWRGCHFSTHVARNLVCALVVIVISASVWHGDGLALAAALWLRGLGWPQGREIRPLGLRLEPL
jgi:hypothetical protein